MCSSIPPEDSCVEDLVTLGLLAALLVGAWPAHAASITFASRDVQVGSLFDVDILVTDLDEPIIGFALNFTFDSTVLALQGVAERNILVAGAIEPQF